MFSEYHYLHEIYGNMFHADYHYSIDSFGREVPENWEEILTWLNNKLDSMLVYDSMFNLYRSNYQTLSREGRDVVDTLWDRYWAGYYETAPKPILMKP